MVKRKRSAKVGLIISIIVGLSLIFTGIFFPIMMRKSTFEYSEDFRFDKMYYEFDIDTKEKLNTETGKVKIKVQGTNTETFEIYLDEDESDIHEGEYSFVTLLLDENASIFNEIVEIEIYNESGKLLRFKPESMHLNFSLVPMMIIPIFFGIVFLMFGIVVISSKNARAEMQNTLSENRVLKDDSQMQIEKQEKETITCNYCGLENNPDNAKCEHCGGPLYRNK